jgi:hypothetical protein
MEYITLKPPAKSNKQVQEYIKAAQKGLDSYLVVQNGANWYVQKGSFTTSYGKRFSSKTDAIANAKRRARRRKSEVFILGRDGSTEVTG